MTKHSRRSLKATVLGAMLLQAALAAQASATTIYFCVNNQNGTKDTLVDLDPIHSTVFVRQIPGMNFTVNAQYSPDNTVAWVFYHRGLRASGSVSYLLNRSTSILQTHLVATTMFGTRVNSRMTWMCRLLPNQSQ